MKCQNATANTYIFTMFTLFPCFRECDMLQTYEPYAIRVLMGVDSFLNRHTRACCGSLRYCDLLVGHTLSLVTKESESESVITDSLLTDSDSKNPLPIAALQNTHPFRAAHPR